jgi:hypothetical protein
MAVATGNHIPAFLASQGNLAYTASQVTYSGSTALSAISNILDLQVIQCKNLTVTMPKGEVEKQDLLGVESTTVGAGVPITGVFQNAIMDEKPWTNATITGTLIFTAHNDGDAAKLPDFVALATGVGDTISTTYHRHSFGDTTATQVRVTAGAIILNLDNGVQEASAMMNEPFVNLGEMKLTGSDGHWELDFEATCLPKNFVLEIKDQD